MVVVSIFLRSIVLLFKSITAPTCLSKDTGVKGGTPGLSTTVYFTIPLTPPMPEGISTFPNTLALPPMPTAWLSPGMTRGLSPNLWKRASSAFRKGRTSMIPLCAAVSANDSPGSTSMPENVAMSLPLHRELINWFMLFISKNE